MSALSIPIGENDKITLLILILTTIMSMQLQNKHASRPLHVHSTMQPQAKLLYVKFRSCREGPMRLIMDAWRFKMEPQRVCMPMVADLHHFWWGAGFGSAQRDWKVEYRSASKWQTGSGYQSEKVYPDPHQVDAPDADPQPWIRRSKLNVGFSATQILEVRYLWYLVRIQKFSGLRIHLGTVLFKNKKKSWVKR